MGSSMSSSNGVSHASGFGHTSVHGHGHGLFGQSYSYSHSHGQPQQFYFDPDMDSPHRRPDCCSTKSELRDKLESLADVTEKIKEVRYYTHPLNTWQTSSRYAFIVLETDSWWWSVDKDDRGVTIQRSKCVENVRDFCRRQSRSAAGAGSGIEMAKKPSGNISVIELLNRFWMRDRANLEIHFQTNNNGYQHFADILYDFV
ncbi:uncharacterized protein LOC124204621 [Daphnia pulex]|uniref:uncharacterized protein LOC124204621 n=1 Tax=Daphnia pulex TaxID=6669 RepID=UPI001EE03CF0|nr:uncharacterized protein LOC124204621 [Daphnia pulex]XP_046457669.1 uncharacterized protein LOC124204621 [Daphnia pulex]